MRLILQNLTLRVLILVTFVLGLTPLIIYACARLWFHLPDEVQWNKNGGNGGPWGNESLLEIFLVTPLFLLTFLPFVTFTIGAALAVKQKRVILLAAAIALCIVQWAFAYWQLMVVFWTVE